MFPGDESLPTAFLSAKEQDLKPLLEEGAEALDLDSRQLTEFESFLQRAWLFGVKVGHKFIVEAKLGEADPESVLLDLHDEFQALMERCADALNLSVGTTLVAWSYLGRAWIAGARFWEVEITARLIESQHGGFDEALRKLEE
jgi:hypothetical protein